MDKLKSLERVEDSFAKLPSVGHKSAERMTYALLSMNEEDINEFVDSIKDLKNKIHPCPKCGILMEGDTCPICDNPNRDNSIIMVVAETKDVFQLEKSEGYNGLYHVLNGEISISKGIDVDALRINELVERIKALNIEEVIIATNPTLDGETTALYIAKTLSDLSVTVTRLAYGLQMGGNIDYTDQLTLLKALEGRRKI